MKLSPRQETGSPPVIVTFDCASHERENVLSSYVARFDTDPDNPPQVIHLEGRDTGKWWANPHLKHGLWPLLMLHPDDWTLNRAREWVDTFDESSDPFAALVCEDVRVALCAAAKTSIDEAWCNQVVMVVLGGAFKGVTSYTKRVMDKLFPSAYLFIAAYDMAEPVGVIPSANKPHNRILITDVGLNQFVSDRLNWKLNVRTLADLEAHSLEEIEATGGLGKKTIKEVLDLLPRIGAKLRTEGTSIAQLPLEESDWKKLQWHHITTIERLLDITGTDLEKLRFKRWEISRIQEVLIAAGHQLRGDSADAPRLADGRLLVYVNAQEMSDWMSGLAFSVLMLAGGSPPTVGDALNVSEAEIRTIAEDTHPEAVDEIIAALAEQQLSLTSTSSACSDLEEVGLTDL